MVIGAIPPGTGGPTREYRAAVTLVIAATFVLVVLLLVIGVNPEGQPVRWAVSLVGPIVLMVTLFATAFGLAQRAEWAAAAMTPLLYLLVVSGAISFVLALTRSTFEIPIGLILAIWALRAPTSRSARPNAVTAAVLAVAVVAALWAFPAELLLRPGGPLIVDETAFQPALGVTCAPPVGADPARIHVSYDWHWLRSEPWAGGQDVVKVEVFPEGTESGLIGLALGEADPLAPGISQEDISIFGPLGLTFGIDLATTGFGPQTVGFGLVGPTTLGSGVVDVKATYRHGSASSDGNTGTALWTVETSVDCEW
jgi:hypothetical protein